MECRVRIELVHGRLFDAFLRVYPTLAVICSPPNRLFCLFASQVDPLGLQGNRLLPAQAAETSVISLPSASRTPVSAAGMQ
jgi:hypothetical protein